jgi:hypothetical protein
VTINLRSRRLWLSLFAVLALVFFSLLSFIWLRSSRIEERTRTWVIAELSRRFQSTVELQSLRVRVSPVIGVKGTGLVLRWHNRLDVPPLILVKEFSFNLGLTGLFRAPRHISSINVRDMVITVAPRQAQREPSNSFKPSQAYSPQVIVDQIVCNDALLLVLSSKPGKDPLDFDIHNLVLNNVSVGQPFTFRGNLTNAKPRGEISTTGRFGPWNAEQPGDSGVSGRYHFQDADLGPLPGIAGILSSYGTYDGQLNKIHVAGETYTPDFSLDNVGRKMLLQTEFDATVDGTDGDTYLHPVKATLGHSLIIANGRVVRVPHSQGHLISLDVSVNKGRLEDVLHLAVKSATSPLSGPLHLQSKLVIPPGAGKIVDKLFLDGNFETEDARFASTDIREKLAALSRHGLGKPANEQAGSSLSTLTGDFRLDKGVMTFKNLFFGVEGADLNLDGEYKIRDEDLDFEGELRLKAKVSQTLTGVKSVLARPFDPLFEKHGAGTVLPIRITGNRENPVFSTTVFHKTFKKEMSSRFNDKDAEK